MDSTLKKSVHVYRSLPPRRSQTFKTRSDVRVVGGMDQVHHPSEELIFDRLRAHTSETHPILDILTKQHVLLGQMNKRFRQSLEGIMHEEVLRRDEVEVQGREYVKVLRDHLSMEEAEAFPLARERLAASDWDDLLEEAPSGDDPVFGDADPARFRTLFQHLMAQAQP